MAKKKAKKKIGRPTKYKKIFCKKLIKFFDQEPYTDVEIDHFDKEKGKVIVWTDIKRMPNELPTLRNFAKEIKVGIRTIYDWLDEKHSSFHQEFSHAFTCAQGIRKDFLIQNGLQGLYPPASFKFVAVNLTDMRDKSEQEHSGTIEHDLSPEILALGKQMATKYAQEAK